MYFFQTLTDFWQLVCLHTYIFGSRLWLLNLSAYSRSGNRGRIAFLSRNSLCLYTLLKFQNHSMNLNELLSMTSVGRYLVQQVVVHICCLCQIQRATHLRPPALGLSILNPWPPADTCHWGFKPSGGLRNIKNSWRSWVSKERFEASSYWHVMSLWIHTEKAVDEAKWKAKRADNGWDDFMLHINLKSTFVHIS